MLQSSDPGSSKTPSWRIVMIGSCLFLLMIRQVSVSMFSLNEILAVSSSTGMMTTTMMTRMMVETPPPLHVRPNIRPRNFVQYPITNIESAQIEQHLQARYAHHLQNNNNNTIPRIALCHPTIHYNEGDSSQTWDNMLDPFMAMISYYRLLGVSHIFAWYEPYVVNATRWNELVHTTSDYVTLTSLHQEQAAAGGRARGDNYHGQKAVETACMGHYAADYDWVMKQDADEFFWWSQKGNLIDFALAYDNYTFISLGKYPISMIHRYRHQQDNMPDNADHNNNNNNHGNVSTTAVRFGVEHFSFTPGSYCYQKKGNRVCPSWIGRCKIFARPKHHPKVSVHGDGGPVGKSSTAIHLDTSVARFNEFFNLHLRERRTNVTLHDLATNHFWSSSTEEVGVWSNVNSYASTKDGKVKVFHDPTVPEFMNFVAHGCPVADSHTTANLPL